MNKKIIFSLLLVLIVAMSLSIVSASNDNTNTIGDTDAIDDTDEIAITEDRITTEDTITTNTISITHTGNDTADIENLISSANDGDIVDLGSDYNYILNETTINNYSNNTITTCIEITKNITIKGDNVIISGYGYNNSLKTIFYIHGEINKTTRKSSPITVVIQGITFKPLVYNTSYTNDTTLTGDSNGTSIMHYTDSSFGTATAIYLYGNENSVIENCSFENFNYAIEVQMCTNTTIDNCTITGSSTKMGNNISSEEEELSLSSYGTVGIFSLASKENTITNNIFSGPLYVAIHISQLNSANNTITGNIFKKNAHSIIFNGLSVNNDTIISNNLFDDCGYFEANYTLEDESVKEIIYKGLEIIYFSAGTINYDGPHNFEIKNNTFNLRDGTKVISLNAFNSTITGSSKIGNINITGNTLTTTSNDTDTSTITLLSFINEGGDLALSDPIAITENNLVSGMKTLYYWDNEWGVQGEDVILTTENLIETIISIKNISITDGTLTAVLTTTSGKEIKDANISYTINGENPKTAITNSSGITITGLNETSTIIFSYAGNSSYAPTSTSFDFIISPVESNTTENSAENTTYNNITNNTSDNETNTKITTILIVETITANNIANITTTLSDTDGNTIANANISYTINNKNETNKITNNEGKINIYNLTENSLITFNYAGDDSYSACNASANVVINFVFKKATTIVFENMTTTAIYVNRSGEYFYAGLTDGDGNPLVNKTVQIGFNGATYTRTTNENGIIKLQVNLKVAGGYTFAICFLGDNDYNSSFAVAKITVKKATTKLTNVKSKYTYKSSATSKSIAATLKLSNGTVISGKTVKFTVNGKTYSTTTNSKGVATVKVSITAKKTYKYTVKFAATTQLAAASTTGTLVIK